MPTEEARYGGYIIVGLIVGFISFEIWLYTQGYNFDF